VTEPTADYSIRPEAGDETLPLEARLEALLFVSAAPIPPRLAETLGTSANEAEQALARLRQQLAARPATAASSRRFR
jgi:chromosome segregation and condensation protein ScpB